MRIAPAVLILVALALSLQGAERWGGKVDTAADDSFFGAPANHAACLQDGQDLASAGSNVPEAGVIPLVIGAALLLVPVLLKLRKNRQS